MSDAGTYTIGMWVYVTSDYDGEERYTHSRWWTSDNDCGLGGDCELGITDGFATPPRDKWTYLTEIFNTTVQVSRFSLYICYPQRNSKGYIYVTDVSVLGPDGTEYIGNGDFSGGDEIAEEWGSYGSYSIMMIASNDEVSRSFIRSQDRPWYMMRFGPSPEGGEYEVHNHIEMSDAGTYTIGMWVYVTSDYDGEERYTHSRWWTSENDCGHGVDCILGITEGLATPARDEWTYLTETFYATNQVSKFSLYICYPQRNSKGYIYVTGVSVLGPDGTEYIGNGDFSWGNDIAEEWDSYGKYSIMRIAGNGEISTRFTRSQNTPQYMIRFGPSPEGGEYEVHNHIEMSDAGTYTIGMWVYVTGDYDGEERYTHSRWYTSDKDCELGLNCQLGTTEGLASPPRDQWTYLTETFNATAQVSKFSLYICYPQRNKNGYVYVTGVSVLGPYGTEYIGNGDFKGGNGIYEEYDSYGTYSIMMIAGNGEISESLIHIPSISPTEIPKNFTIEWPVTILFDTRESEVERLKALRDVARIGTETCFSDAGCIGRQDFDGAAYCFRFSCYCSQILCEFGRLRLEYHDIPEYMMRFGPNPAGGEYQVHNYLDLLVAGTYTIGMWVYVTSDYDGEERYTHSRWWASDNDCNFGIDCEIGTTQGLATPPRDQWTYVTESFSATQEKMKFALYICYPQRNSKGYIYVTGVSVLGPDGTEYIGNGDFSGGDAIDEEYGSYGSYSIMGIEGNGEIPGIRKQILNSSTHGSTKLCVHSGKPLREALTGVRYQPCLTDEQCTRSKNLDSDAYCLDFSCNCVGGNMPNISTSISLEI